MAKRIPPIIRPLLQHYLAALTALQHPFFGIYIYGSVALDAFDQQHSDIDLVALTDRAWLPSELKQLATIHRQLSEKFVLGARLSVMYIPRSALGKYNPDIPSYPYFADGVFHSKGHFDLNAVTWWIIAHHGIAIAGPEPDVLRLQVAWTDVLQAMSYNLNTYWARRLIVMRIAKILMPGLVLPDEMIRFLVTTLCRILTTIEDGQIVTKSQALIQYRDRLPSRFQRLIDATINPLREGDRPNLYLASAERTNDAIMFLEYMIKWGRWILVRSISLG